MQIDTFLTSPYNDVGNIDYTKLSNFLANQIAYYNQN